MYQFDDEVPGFISKYKDVVWLYITMNNVSFKGIFISAQAFNKKLFLISFFVIYRHWGVICLREQKSEGLSTIA